MFRKHIFYGWWISVSAFVSMSVCGATGVYAFSLFVRPLEDSFHWTRAEIMLAFAVWSVASGTSAPFVGRLVDRFGPVKAIITGAIIAGVSCLALGYMGQLWQFYVAYALLGVSAAATGSVPLSAMVSNWFVKRRGLAIGIMSAGIGVGGMVFSPFFGGLTIPALGWRPTYHIAGAVVVVVLVPLAMLVMKTRPSGIGLSPYGGEGSMPAPVVRHVASWKAGLGPVIRTKLFWLVAVSFFFGAFSQLGLLQNQMPYLGDISVPVMTAAGALGAVGLFSTVGKLGVGWLCDHIPARVVWAVSVALQASATVMLMSLRPDSAGWVLWLYAVAAGLGMGGWLPTMSLLVSSSFGLAAYGAIFGVIAFVFALGQALGPFIAGWIVDTTGSYQPAFIMFLAGYLVAGVSILLVRRH
ncbi:MAG: MFS transporter [Chloroflexota bacterium]